MIRLSFYEGTDTQDETVRATTVEEPWRNYLVVNPIFKRGRLWEAGDVIALEPSTAAGFLAAGDIKE